MPEVKGRCLKAPVVSTGFYGEGIVFRVDDDRDPEFWLSLNLTSGELMELLVQWQLWRKGHPDTVRN